MKLENTSDIHDLLEAYVCSAALGFALESELFWRLKAQAHTVEEVARFMNIPTNRCRYWLDLLVKLNLLDYDGTRYFTSKTAHEAIIDAHGREAWRNIAHEWRDSFPAVSNLPKYIREPGSVWEGLGIKAPDYFDQLKDDPERARRFTRMLYEFHRSLADSLAEALDMTGVKRLMDLGGGSGVMSMALLDRNPHLNSVIVDIENVCKAGREILAERGVLDQITYFEADLLQDDLPHGFDMVLECDVGIHDEVFFRKIKDSLNPNGRLIVVSQFPTIRGTVPSGRYMTWGLLRSLRDPDFSFPLASDVHDSLTKAGFRVAFGDMLPDDWLVIEASV